MLSVSALSDRVCFAVLAIGAAGLVAAGLILGDVMRLQPCHLCILQRVIYLAFGVVAAGGVVKPGWRRFWCVVLMLVAAGGVVAAGQQSWMQYAPELATECGFGEPTLTEQLVNWLGMQWPALFLATGFCTSREWEFLSLSMANWSLLIFAGIVGYAVLLFMRRE